MQTQGTIIGRRTAGARARRGLATITNPVPADGWTIVTVTNPFPARRMAIVTITKPVSAGRTPFVTVTIAPGHDIFYKYFPTLLTI